MDDIAWLATKVGTFAASPTGIQGTQANPAGIVVEPTHIGQARKLSDHVIALAGWPTGRHHTLVKAAEARLAGETGASEVWVVVDKLSDENATLGELVAVRQGVEPPVRLGAIVPPGQESVAFQAGVDVVAVEYGADIPAGEVAVYGEIPNLEATVELLSAGATRVFAADPKAALRQS
ncbi:deoxyribose-phosphate aldolase [Corynebacterium sp. S7]